MNTIDLSKAYVGQYITLANGKEYRIGDITNGVFQSYIWSCCHELRTFYTFDGKNSNKDSELDIIAIEDAPEIKMLKNYAQIEALEWALKYVSNLSERGRLCAKINELRLENVELTVNGNESN